MNQYCTKSNKKLSKEVKSDNFYNHNVGRALTKWGFYYSTKN